MSRLANIAVVTVLLLAAIALALVAVSSFAFAIQHSNDLQSSSPSTPRPPPPPPPTVAPQIAPQFLASVLVNNRTLGQYLYDEVYGRLLFTSTFHLPFSSALVSTIEWANRTVAASTVNEVCRVRSDIKAFPSYLEKLSSANFTGTAQVRHITCQRWLYVTPGNSALTYEFFTYENTLLLIRRNHAGTPLPVFTLELLTFSATSFTTDQLSMPHACSAPTFHCPYEGIQNLSPVFSSHNITNNFDLNNTNIADLQGQAQLLCLMFTAPDIVVPTSFDAISQFELQVNSSFGQYQVCTAGQCVGANDLLVGQEVAFGAAPYGGQCMTSSSLGNWYSLPARSYCTSIAAAPANSICSWSVVTRVKTIATSCLLQQGFKQMCLLALPNGPLLQAQRVLAQAFASDSAPIGGCPDISIDDFVRRRQ